MRHSLNQSGFTIIETILFLAISTGMIFTAMSVVTGRTQSVRFDDGVRSLESFIDRRVSNVRSGSVINADQSCTKNPDGSYSSISSDGSCIFLGYVLHFGQPTASQMQVYQIFGERLTSSDIATCTAGPGGETPLSCADPVPLPATAIETYDIPWSLELTQMRNGGDDVEMIGFLRSPDGIALTPVAFDIDDPADLNNSELYKPSAISANSWYGDEVGVKACYTDEDRRASMNIGNDNRRLTIETLYNDPECPSV